MIRGGLMGASDALRARLADAAVALVLQGGLRPSEDEDREERRR
jgi:hypothetical protein